MFFEEIDVVKMINLWSPNILTLEINHLHKLATLAHIQTGFIQDFQISEDTWLTFLWKISNKYTKHENPFHNYHHGVSVMHCVYKIVSQAAIKDRIGSYNAMVLVFAAFCHDVGHPGRTNNFEANSLSKRSLTFLDKSVIFHFLIISRFLKITILLPHSKLLEKRIRICFLHWI